MKLYDITQELFDSVVFPGDPAPEYERLLQIKEGDPCNLTYVKMCAHNGTHLDAPCHFVDGAEGMEEVPLSKVMGSADVIAWDGVLDGENARKLLDGKEKRVLFKGNTVLTEEAASEFIRQGLVFVGVESQTVGPVEQPEVVKEIHRILLGGRLVIGEGLVLKDVEEGPYFLCAQPLKLAGSDGAPCRAVLIDFE